MRCISAVGRGANLPFAAPSTKVACGTENAWPAGRASSAFASSSGQLLSLAFMAAIIEAGMSGIDGCQITTERVDTPPIW